MRRFGECHIPTTESIALTALKDASLGRNDKLVLHSDGNIHSGHTKFLQKADGFKGVHILRGGLEEWKDAVLFPRLTENATQAEAATFEKSKLLSKVVGGAAEAVGSKIALPKLESPTGSQPKTAGPKKRKEVC